MKDRLFHQLQGFLSTPALWKDNQLFNLKQFSFPQVSFSPNLDIPAKIPSISTNFVLGKRIESFFELSIQKSVSYNLIASNLQIVHNKITIGEIDFLVEDSSNGKKIHVEVIYKFYVYDPSFSEEMERWIGPNRKDSLIKKISKLKEKQLPLLHKEETKEILVSHNLKAENLEQEVSFKAFLFLPRNHPASLVSGINPDCIVGSYLHLKDFNYSEYSEYQYHAPAKQDWPANPRYNKEWISFTEIHKYIMQMHSLEKSPLIWIKKNNDFDTTFVVWW